MMDAKGNVLEGPVSIFTDHFMVKGLYAYVLALKRRGEKWQKAGITKRLTEILFENVKRQEVLSQGRDTTRIPETRSEFHDSHIVALESRKLYGDTYRSVLEECVHKSLYEFASDRYNKPLNISAFRENLFWRGLEGVIDAGHTMEALWFSMTAGLELGDRSILERAGVVLDWVIDSCYDREFGRVFTRMWMLLNTIRRRLFEENDYAGNPVRWDDISGGYRQRGLCSCNERTVQ
ncbi:MAG: hypothetical protein ACLUL2_12075 [Blautia sp.]